MKTEENRATKMTAANGVIVTTVYDHEEKLLAVTLRYDENATPIDIPGALFAQAAAMSISYSRYGKGGMCADHGAFTEGGGRYSWDCPVCHPPAPPPEPKALPEVTPGPVDLAKADIPF